MILQVPDIGGIAAASWRDRIKAVVLDLDGTCIDEELFIHPRTEEMIRLAARQLPVIIATGRMYRSALIWAQRLEVSEPLVCYQGALVRDVPGGGAGTPATHLNVVLEQEIAARAIDLARAHDWHRQVYVDDVLYCEQRRAEAEFYASIAQVPINYVGDLHAIVGHGSTKITCVDHDPQVMAQCRDLMRDALAGRARVMTSLPQFCEIVDPGINKAVAVAYPLRNHGLSLATALAIGDGNNDIDLIAGAAFGVAVATGNRELVAHADAVCAGPRQGGVGDVLEALLGG